MDERSRDLIGDEHFDHDQDDELGPTTLVQAVKAPEVLALASLMLAAISLLGFGLLNGSPYLPALYSASGPPEKSLAIAASVLGAGLALLPAALGAAALRGLPYDSRSRVIAGTGILLASVSIVLRLAVAARVALDDGVQFVQF